MSVVDESQTEMPAHPIEYQVASLLLTTALTLFGYWLRRKK